VRPSAGNAGDGHGHQGERIVRVYLRTVVLLTVAVLATFLLLALVWACRRILVWLAIAGFLAIAINPLVAMLQRYGLRSRPAAVTAAALIVIGALVLLGLLVLPPLIDQVDAFAKAVPGYVDDLTKGRGRLGFLERDYHIVERVRERIDKGASGAVFGVAGGVLSATTSLFSILAATVTITVMVIFLLLGGPGWIESFYGYLPEESQARWRALGDDLYRAVGGYVRGNLAISVIAGASTYVTLRILEVPYALALAVVVGIFDLVPLVGATVGAVIVGLVALTHSVGAAIAWVIFAIVYQQVENHFLQPVIYGRSVQLPSFAVLVAVLVGAQLAGVVGALGAIPIASGIHVIVLDVVHHRRGAEEPPATSLL
jgi:predicted PurR-regulated permease PerM